MFKCDCCGLCCKNILMSKLYYSLDRGDGVCKFFDDEYSLCSIYNNRPIECNIGAMYDSVFSDVMTKEEYYELNYLGCEELKNKIQSKF